MSDSLTTTKTGGRTYYDGDVDFDALAENDEDFASICKTSKNKRWIDFQDPTIVQQLTKSLMKCDFGLSIELPHDRLCPPVPVRWNYVHWIQELLDTTSETYNERYDAEREVVGLDIGVGASCIYPLLACSTRPAWGMLGTDIDEHSLEYARRNVAANNLTKRVKLIQTKSDGSIIPMDTLGIQKLDFVICNPPFYASAEDMSASYGTKQTPPSAICTGAANEMICPGGDVGFVSRILDESLRLRERVQWYTAMFGKLTSLQQLVAQLKLHGITNFAATCLQAGFKTKRWALGWSFAGYRPRIDVARHGELVQAILPQPAAQTIAVPLMSAEWAGEKIDAIMARLDVRWQWRATITTGLMEARENVWSRAARRKKQFQQQIDLGETVEAGKVQRTNEADKDSDGTSDEDSEDPVALAVKITCADEKVELRWLRGDDHVLFQSFCGLLKRTLTGQP